MPQIPCQAASSKGSPSHCSQQRPSNPGKQSISLAIISVATSALISRLCHDWKLLLGLMDDDVVWKRHLGTHLALRIVCKHDLYPHAEDTLAHHHVTRCMADVMPLWLTGGDEVSVAELHDLCTLCSELATDDDLAALGAIFHDEAHNSVASTTHCKSTQELIA